MVRKPKSPNYPSVDLGTAIDLAKQLYTEGVGKGEFTPLDAAQAWGYNSVSGPVRVRIGALRQYGLIEGKRGRHSENPKLTRRALTFIMRPQGSREYQAALQEAAVTPPLFSELHQSHRNAADGVLREYLVIDKNFTDDGAQRFINAYKTTLRLARLGEEGTMSGLDDDESPDEGEEDHVVTEASPQGTGGPVRSIVPGELISIPVPLGAERIATVTLPIDMQDADWTRLDRILEAYKPQRVEESSTTGESPAEGDS